MDLDLIKTYDDATGKRFIQDLHYSRIENEFKSDSTVLIGPNSKFCVEKIIKNISPDPFKIFGYENDIDIYCNQLLDLNEFIDSGKVQLHYANIIHAKPTLYYDLDLMCTLTSAQILLTRLFDKQALAFKDEKKIFYFTVCGRDYHAADLNRLDVIGQLFSVDLELKEKVKLQHGYEYILNVSDPNKIITMCSYRDSTPMYSIMLQYI